MLGFRTSWGSDPGSVAFWLGDLRRCFASLGGSFLILDFRLCGLGAQPRNGVHDQQIASLLPSPWACAGPRGEYKKCKPSDNPWGLAPSQHHRQQQKPS